VRFPTPRLTAACAVCAAALTACAAAPETRPAVAVEVTDWTAVVEAARGQTLDWYMYTGDETVNAVVEDHVAPRMAVEYGVTLQVVPVADTADAVNKVLAERQAARTGSGTVDAIWINGENFATGKQADLWLCGYPQALPNARYVDLADPAAATDFGVPVEGCEAAWQQAASGLVYDSAALTGADVASLTDLSDWARSNPGRVAYPAPPDFTGSMVVRTFLYDTAGDPSQLPAAFDPATFAPLAERLWARLNALERSLWRGGETYPTSQAAVEQLYATGEIDAYFTYGPGTVARKVADGAFPATTRVAVPSIGNIANVSFLAIPADAADQEAALVLANLLQDPQTQLRFYVDAGIYPVLALDRLAAEVRQRFDAVDPGPVVPPLAELTARALPELEVGYVEAVEDGWTANVLQR
jgi:putative spermidine/putrescine transport system substrate-binding protein